MSAPLDIGQSQSASEKSKGISGNLGVLDIVLATLAFAGPLAGTAGYITIIIAFGNGIGAPVTFLAVMLAFLAFAVGYGAMTKYVTSPGAFYSYITAGLGKPAGLGSSFLILGSYLSIGVGFYGFAGIAARQFVAGLGGPDIVWWAYSLVFWIAVGTLAYFHVAVSAKVLGVLLIAEVLVVLVFDAAVMFQGGAEGISLQPLSFEEFTSGGLGIALIFGAALFCGFEATAIYREEAKNPDRTIPRATIIVAVFIGVFYAITAWALITGLGTSQAVELAGADSAGAFFAVAAKFGGKLFVDVASVLLLTSVLAAHLAIQNVTARYTYSLAVDGVFPRMLGEAHPRHRSPHRASMAASLAYLVLTGLLVIVGLTAEEIYAWFAGVASFTILCAMAITSLAAFVFFQRRRDIPISLWRGTIAPALSFLSLGVMVILGIINFPSLIGGSEVLSNIMLATSIAVFVLGYVVALRLKSRRPEVYERVGRQ